MTQLPPPSPHPIPRHIRRLGFFMIILTALLLIVLALYAYPLVSHFFYPITASARPITPRGDLMAVESTTIDIFKHASPSVAFITTETQRLNRFSKQVTEVPHGSGSGFVWDDDGHIVTNYHVIKDATSAHVILFDQSIYTAHVVGFSADHDLAVLKINLPLGVHLIPLPLGTSSDLQVGQSVFAIGNPFGLDQSLTTGIISALKRTINGDGSRPIEDVIQTDAAINPGNSGGPLLDSAGRLIGVNTAIFSTSGSWTGIGFAIPADTANQVIPELINHGHYTPAHLGIQFLPASQNLLDRRHVNGLVLSGIEPNSPAEKAGLTPISPTPDGSFKLGDIITQLNDTPIKSPDDLLRAMDHIHPGDQLTLQLYNDGHTRTVPLTAGQ